MTAILPGKPALLSVDIRQRRDDCVIIMTRRTRIRPVCRDRQGCQHMKVKAVDIVKKCSRGRRERWPQT